MSADHVAAPAASPAAPAVSTGMPLSRLWGRVALFLAGGAQLITIAALLNVTSSVSLTWSSVLLAAAPAPIVAVAAFARPPADLAAAATAIVVMVVGLAGQATHTGPLFAPAIVMLAFAAAKMRKEQAGTPGQVTTDEPQPE